MKCKSVACIWSGSPPLQRVTATAALDQPPTLYTGGSDGSIIWWNLDSSPEKAEIKPVAMLCGHTAPIADLGICVPVEGADNEKLSNSSTGLTPNSIHSGALISACTDGVLCVWSRASGHCRRRRKIPPWAGSPVLIRPFPGKRRYVCLICCSPNREHMLLNAKEGDESSAARELATNPLKFAVLVIDSYTLTIVQTVFHGNVALGPLKSMGIVLASEDMEKQSVMVVDSFGKVLYLPILEDPETKGQNVPGVSNDSSNLVMVDWHSKEKGPLVAVAKCGHVLALAHRTYCIFRQVNSGAVFGTISFVDDQLCLRDELCVIGGIFLGDDDQSLDGSFVEEFVAWNNMGTAVIYRISYLGNMFKTEPLSTIHAVQRADETLSFSFVPINNYLLRVESICFHEKEHMFWKPRVTIWLLPRQNDNYGKICLECVMLGEGNLFDLWTMNSSFANAEGPNHEIHDDGIAIIGETTPFENIAPAPSDVDSKYSTNLKPDAEVGGLQVSSSMVISEDYLAPYAIIYGFFNGDVEIVTFRMYFSPTDSFIESPREAGSHDQKYHLTGHRGAVLCLASHLMSSKLGECNLNHVLLSGSMDCTVRVWDLESGKAVTVLHHHVAPVRQIILPPRESQSPWNDCFLTVGDDSCVALVSLQTLRVERLFPGHMFIPEKVAWDCVKGYIACLCPNQSEKADAVDILYIWDVKTGARERVLRGAAAHSMFDHFLLAINESGHLAKGNTSVSSLVSPVTEGSKSSQSNFSSSGKGFSLQTSTTGTIGPNTFITSNAMKVAGGKSRLPMSTVFQSNKHPIECSCPFPGISTLSFDLNSLMSLCSKTEVFMDGSHIGEKNVTKGARISTLEDGAHQVENAPLLELGSEMHNPHIANVESGSVSTGPSDVPLEQWVRSLEGSLIQFTLSFLHLWNVDSDLDNLLISEMNLNRPDSFIVSSGMLGDRGSMTLTFPGRSATLELWRSSSEYSALRSLTMVSLAQHLISLSHSCSTASSALAAFYTRKFADKVPDVKPPLLQLLVSFWQNEFEHVKMAARSLFHCAASRSAPFPLRRSKSNQQHVNAHVHPYVQEKEHEDATEVCLLLDGQRETQGDVLEEELEITSWLESYEIQDWSSCIAGTAQDAMTSQILVAAALAVWYPSLVKQKLATMVVHPLIKLVMSMNEKYSAAAAEILAEGMESTWKVCICSEIPRLIGDIFFQVECVSGTSAIASAQKPASSLNIREALVGILLPSLAMSDIPGFLHVIESQIWSTASDSPVHVVALMTLIRVIRGSPRNLAPYLDKVVNFILLTMDPGNSTMRRTCLQSSMTALKEVVRVFPMIAINSMSTRLAVGDAIGEVKNASIRVYDMQSMIKIKVLDASGPLGLPSLLGGTSEMAITTAISALSFSPDGEGLVAFSENGLMIRWWSLGSVWWEKLSRNLVPVQCTKLIFVPPWEGFSPNSTRSSIMASAVLHDDEEASSPGSNKGSGEMDRLKLLIHNLDLSYRLEWVGERKVKLTQHSHELGTFQL